MKKRILLVEDDAASRYAAEKVLFKAGFDVITADDYSHALKLMESDEPIDLLLTDIVMPKGINGFALARMGRMRRTDLKVLYMTAYDMPSSHADGKILRKPISENELVEEAKRVMEER